MRIEHQRRPSIPDSVSVMSMEDEVMEDVPLGDDMTSSLDELLIVPPNHHHHERRQSNGALDRKMSLMTRRESVSTRGGGGIVFPTIPNEGFTRAKGIEFDLNQPWQRSLLRELHRIEMEGVNKSDPKPELVLLSHSDSHDNAIEVDQDGISVGTNASSTCPTKPQLVHRSTLNRKNSPKPEHPYHEYRQQALMDDNRDEVAHAELSPKRNHRKREDIVLDDNKTNTNNTRPIPEKLPHNRESKPDNASASTPISRAKHIEEEKQAYLEVELSDDPDVNMMYSDPACFCWGYNVLDFWLQPNTPQYHRRRLSSRRFSASKLGEIMEDEEGMNGSGGDGAGAGTSKRTKFEVSSGLDPPSATPPAVGDA